MGIGVVAVGLWTFVNSDVGSAYIKGLTGHDAIYWAEKGGKKTRFLLKEMTRGFLEKDAVEINNISINKNNFSNIIISKLVTSC